MSLKPTRKDATLDNVTPPPVCPLGSENGHKRPPWKGSDPTPSDTWRNNYLDNANEVQRVNRL